MKLVPKFRARRLSRDRRYTSYCEKKRRYRDKLLAIEACHRISLDSTNYLRVYPCARCKGYHLTSSDQ